MSATLWRTTALLPSLRQLSSEFTPFELFRKLVLEQVNDLSEDLSRNYTKCGATRHGMAFAPRFSIPQEEQPSPQNQ
jgi:hypothetical protein